ncbi:hypothetical protein M1271_03400 [Patescibacteria group bacterium]|nr:hypothetical protein [Patescibacteria group bacterium]
MVSIDRFSGNPLLSPDPKKNWESEAVFNGCVVEEKNADGSFVQHMLYRAMGKAQNVGGINLELSTIGIADSIDRMHFQNRRQLIVPQNDWEKYGCEDPRITKFEGKYYVFYTALSKFPPDADSIKVAVAVTTNLSRIEEKHIVTPFNAKAMALFPERIDGKIAAILTVHTDLPPAKIGIALFDEISQIWDRKYWERWYGDLDHHVIPLLRSINDHVEVGAPPIKTSEGWLILYCYIRNYMTYHKIFGIEGLLLDLHDIRKRLGRTRKPLLIPEKDYELYGKVANVIFPSGALASNNHLGIYYGAADNTCCLATCNLDTLLSDIRPKSRRRQAYLGLKIFEPYMGNPILKPIPEHDWESKYTLNPAAIFLDCKVHILYRAMGKDDTSVLGYASSRNGFIIDERLSEPVYVPRESFEKKTHPGFSGCEDPRLTEIGDRIYMCYTAYDGVIARIALTSITTEDFVNHRWNWEKPILISPPGEFDKDATIFPEKINGKYAFIHRLQSSIWIDYVDDLKFGRNRFLGGKAFMHPRPDKWDSDKIGLGPQILKTQYGWLMIYHGVGKNDKKYRMGAVLLDLQDPSKIIAWMDDPVLEPLTKSDYQGLRPGTVFACGAVVVDNELFMYYGAADQYSSVAKINYPKFLNELKAAIYPAS